MTNEERRANRDARIEREIEESAGLARARRDAERAEWRALVDLRKAEIGSERVLITRTVIDSYCIPRGVIDTFDDSVIAGTITPRRGADGEMIGYSDADGRWI